MHYQPINPRIKRLYTLMRLHRQYRRSSGILSHLYDGKAWKHFDNIYPDFMREPRNVILGFSANGFTLFFNVALPYSYWPIFLTSYYHPLEMWMTSPYIFLSYLIFGPHNPKHLIYVYLHPLIENASRKNKVESDPQPPLLTRHQILESISQLPKVSKDSPSILPGYGVENNWTKQSIY